MDIPILQIKHFLFKHIWLYWWMSAWLSAAFSGLMPKEIHLSEIWFFS